MFEGETKRVLQDAKDMEGGPLLGRANDAIVGNDILLDVIRSIDVLNQFRIASVLDEIAGIHEGKDILASNLYAAITGEAPFL